ncbi:hypothetical protein ACFWBB_27795 [Streptomyces sp. NPDC060000]|uniref:hypothetical protein n=1 Tax=Streptomyces sp. NPDC060000 TaxID=3347031 RepID=UPI0036A2ED8A
MSPQNHTPQEFVTELRGLSELNWRNVLHYYRQQPELDTWCAQFDCPYRMAYWLPESRIGPFVIMRVTLAVGTAHGVWGGGANLSVTFRARPSASDPEDDLSPNKTALLTQDDPPLNARLVREHFVWSSDAERVRAVLSGTPFGRVPNLCPPRQRSPRPGASTSCGTSSTAGTSATPGATTSSNENCSKKR